MTITKDHCKKMFKNLGLDASGLENYGDELTQDDLDELTGWQRNYKELCAMHDIMKYLAILSGIFTVVAAGIILIKNHYERRNCRTSY